MKKNRGIARFLAGLCLLSVFLAGCKPQKKEELTVYMPDGAPAIAMAGLMAADTKGDGVDYKVVTPALISSKVTNKAEGKNADLCVLPLTAASKLLGDGERYQMLGAVTHGNLYLIAKEDFLFDGLSSLVGKTVGVLQINEVPGLTLKATLQRAQIAYEELKNDGERAENAVNLLAVTGADAVGVANADCFLIAEPAASLQAKKGYRIVGDLQALYGGEKGYPQAVLVAKKSVIAGKAEWLDSFLSSLQGGAAWLQTASGEDIVSTIGDHLEDMSAQTSLQAAALSREVVGRCGIYFTYASECKGEAASFLTDLISVNDMAAAMPAEEFYWQGKKGS